jgi:hypothetical protein
MKGVGMGIFDSISSAFSGFQKSYDNDEDKLNDEMGEGGGDEGNDAFITPFEQRMMDDHAEEERLAGHPDEIVNDDDDD